MTRAQRIALAMAGYPVKREPEFVRIIAKFTVPPDAPWLRYISAKYNRPSILVSSPKGIPCA